MSKPWPTQAKDMMIAEEVMTHFVDAPSQSLSLFELVVDVKQKSMDFQLAQWVKALAIQFKMMYGEETGSDVTCRVISACIRNRETLH